MKLMKCNPPTGSPRIDGPAGGTLASRRLRLRRKGRRQRETTVPVHGPRQTATDRFVHVVTIACRYRPQFESAMRRGEAWALPELH